ncbi:MAG TPA: sigma-70 family RNA polymerase sigma factor [Puia sp.]|jgi:RNA polymerase sigma-70 factor (ECF subfamily)
MTINDKDFLTRLSRGEPAALRVLVDDYFPVLCRYARRILPDDGLAKDIVQETFIKLWRYDGSFSTLAGLKGFLFTTTRNGCLNLLRGRERAESRHLKLAEESPQVTDTLMNDILEAESVALIYQVVRRLPEKMREVLFLSFREGLTTAEIAAQLHTTEKNIRKRKYKALIGLRKQFQQPGKPLLLILSLLLR